MCIRDRARTVVVERPVPQSTALLALPGVARDDPEWYAALVMNHILGGGGQQSRLFTEVREKRGLAYGASSSLRVYKRAALLVMSTASANERVAEALRVVKAELARLRVDGPTEQEIADAKTYLAGALALSLDSSGAIAGLLHSMQVDGLAPDHLTKRAALIAAVKIDDVRRLVAQQAAGVKWPRHERASPPPLDARQPHRRGRGGRASGQRGQGAGRERDRRPRPRRCG